MRDEMGNRLVRARDDQPRKHPRYGYLVRDPRPIRKQPRKRKRVCVLATAAQCSGIGVTSALEQSAYARILEKLCAAPDRNRRNRRAKWRNNHG